MPGWGSRPPRARTPSPPPIAARRVCCIPTWRGPAIPTRSWRSNRPMTPWPTRRCARPMTVRHGSPRSTKWSPALSGPGTQADAACSGRYPRVTDIPVFVWIGLGAVLIVSVVQVVRHLSALPALPQRYEIRANAPTIPPDAPNTPEALQKAAYGPKPLRLAGTPNFYVVPAASQTVLWRRDDENKRFVPAGHLPPFTTVQAVRRFRQNGLYEVLITDITIGYIEAARLAAGDVNAARRAYCAYNAGTPPENGEILQRRGAGKGRLTLDNRTTQPAAVKLRDAGGGCADGLPRTRGACRTRRPAGGPLPPGFRYRRIVEPGLPELRRRHAGAADGAASAAGGADPADHSSQLAGGAKSGRYFRSVVRAQLNPRARPDRGAAWPSHCRNRCAGCSTRRSTRRWRAARMPRKASR